MELKLLEIFTALFVLDIVSQVGAQQCKQGKTVTWTDPRGNNHRYLFSWENPSTQGQEYDWEGAQAMCKAHCLNLVSLETREENNFVKSRIASGAVRYIWTSGRKSGGDLVNGWHWSGSGAKIGPTNNPANGDWSSTGGAVFAQPDNRENSPNLPGFRGYDETCLSILNNFYNDGIRWHDVACYHKKPTVCESS